MLQNKKIQIYQFKITLSDIKPPIWRRIQVPSNLTFKSFHEVIQHAMGWENCHLHQFIITSPKNGIIERISIHFEDPIEEELDVINESRVKISSYFSLNNKKAKYEYDFGDSWMHDILLEKIMPIEENIKYPRCISGKRSCPPEDCGGVWGYYDFLEIIKNPDHPEYKERIEWIGEFDFEAFDAKEVKFPNAKILVK
jgi:hypothetical protein